MDIYKQSRLIISERASYDHIQHMGDLKYGGNVKQFVWERVAFSDNAMIN